MSTDVFALHNVDYSEKGMEQGIIVEGRRKLQTVIYSTLDYLGEKWYYTEEGHRYILDARSRRGRQRFVKGYLDKIPVIVRQPIIVGRDSDQPQNLFYYGAVAIEEHGFKRELLAVVDEEEQRQRGLGPLLGGEEQGASQGCCFLSGQRSGEIP